MKRCPLGPRARWDGARCFGLAQMGGMWSDGHRRYPRRTVWQIKTSRLPRNFIGIHGEGTNNYGGCLCRWARPRWSRYWLAGWLGGGQPQKSFGLFSAPQEWSSKGRAPARLNVTSTFNPSPPDVSCLSPHLFESAICNLFIYLFIVGRIQNRKGGLPGHLSNINNLRVEWAAAALQTEIVQPVPVRSSQSDSCCSAPSAWGLRCN